MAQEHINTGTPNGNDGDFLRDAFVKTENNFIELYKISNEVSVINVTYSQLTTLISASELVKGQVYLLTDYMTTYTQPVTGVSKGLDAVIEPLYLTATDVNKLSNIAYSQLYPQDIVYYEVTGNIDDGKGTEGFTKGKIYRRIDTQRNNDIGTDWRHVKYDRDGVDKLLFEDYTNCGDNIIKQYYLSNNVVGSGFFSNTIEVGFTSNTIANNFTSNKIGVYFSNNTIGNYFSTNTVSSGFTMNTVGDYFTYNNISTGFSENTIPDNIQNNKFTVVTLPTGVSTGQEFIVTDALNPSFLTTLTGGGDVVCPVLYDGSKWVATVEGGNAISTTNRFEARCLGQAVNGRIENYDTAVENIGLKDSPASLLFDSKVCGVGEEKLFNLKPFERYNDFTVSRPSTATYIDKDGLIQTAASNVPRIDYSDGEGALLTEPQSTNLYLNNRIMVTQDVTTSASTYTVSFYGSGTITFSGTFTGSLVGTGENERVSLTFTATSGTLTSAISGIVTYGQIENLSYATSVIITEVATVTRLADVITDGGSVDDFNSEEGVLYWKGSFVDDGLIKYITISDGTYTNKVILSLGTNLIQARLSSNGGNQGYISTSGIYTGNLKIALTYKEDFIELYINEISIGVDASFPIFDNNTLNVFHFADGIGAPNFFYGETQQIKVYKSIAEAQQDLPYIT